MRSHIKSMMALCSVVLLASCIAKVEKKIPVYPDSVQDTALEDETTPDVNQDVPELVDGKDVAEVEPQDTAELIPVESAKVFPAGGHFLLEGGIELLIPAGAVTEEAGITIEAIGFPGATLPEGPQAVSAVWAFEPHGTVFAKPVTLGLPRSAASVDVAKWTLLKGLVGGLETLDSAEQVPAWGNPDDGIVYVQTLHFSLIVAVLAQGGGTVVCGDVELCNGKDDDCDGQEDEAPLDPMGQACTDQGVCEDKVQVACTDGKWVCNYAGIEGYEAQEETCDGLDNDCDGATDEGIAGDALDIDGDTCNTEGPCKTVSPFAYCVMGEWFCDYSPVTAYHGIVEFECDGVDNNCDGTKDESACDGFEACTDNSVCISGLCGTPYGETGSKFCTFHANSCLARDGQDLVEVSNGATRCTDATKVAICQSGLWSPSAQCSAAFPGTFKCDAGIGACSTGCDLNTDCIDDGNVCNGVPVCIDHACVLDPLSPMNCAGDDCNTPNCNPITGACTKTPKNQGGPCDDGLKCTVLGTCNAGLCINQTAVDCNDQKFCTTDSCNPDTGLCLNDPVPQLAQNCSDGKNCTFGDKCQADGMCVGTQNTCDDGKECTYDECLEASGLCNNDYLVKEGFSCQDSNGCTLNDLCITGECVGTAKVCLDSNDCTLDGCDPLTGECTGTPANTGFSCKYPNNAPGAQDPCTPLGSCNTSGTCLPGTDLCECRSDSDCVALDNGDKCDGILRCNLLLAPYTCYFDATTVVSCSTAADTECRKNLCTPATGLCGMKDLADGTTCNDGNACTISDKCKTGACTDTQPLVCDDSDPCTLNQCIPASGCSYPDAPNTTACEDGDPCTLNDKCDGAGGCAAGAPKTPACDDSNVCTNNTCSPDGQSCLFEPLAGCCLLDAECVSPAVCFNNACCTPQCSGKECGDNGCGGSCGSCEAWEDCVSNTCECPDCCTSSSECGVSEVCDKDASIPVCATKARTYARGFEGELAGTSGIPPSGFLFSYTNGGSNPNPWKVRSFSNGANCNSGTYVLQYYKSGSLNASGTLSFWHYVPTTAESATREFSFYSLCPLSANPPAWSMTVLINGSTALTFDQSTSCTGAYIRRSIDLAALGIGGMTKFTFSFTKIATSAVVSLYLDDLAIFADNCLTLDCQSFTQSNGLCVPGTPVGNACYIDGTCWGPGDLSANFPCLRCDPAVNKTAWLPDATLCPVGETCDPSYADDGCKLP